MKKLIVTGDITRFYCSQKERRLSGQMHIEMIYHIFNRILSYASNMPVEKIDTATLGDLTSFFSTLYRQKKESANWDDWSRIYYARPHQEFLNMVEMLFGESFVIGVEMSPFMKASLCSLGIQYIDIVFDPARFTRHLTLSFNSNSQEIITFFQKHTIEESLFFIEADYQRARYAPNVRSVKITPGVLMILGQTEYDKVLIREEGGFHSLLDYQAELDAMIAQSAFVCFKPHPNGTNKAVIEYFRDKGVHILPEKGFPVLNTYIYLSHPGIEKLVALNSSMLIEGYFFEKNVVNLIPFEFSFNHARFTHTEKSMVFPIDIHIYTDPLFWYNLFRASGCCLEKMVPFTNPIPVPNLRLIFRGGGGNSFDDAQSYTHCCKIGALENRMSVVEQYCKKV